MDLVNPARNPGKGSVEGDVHSSLIQPVLPVTISLLA
jgi:hypothetical protein